MASILAGARGVARISRTLGLSSGAEEAEAAGESGRKSRKNPGRPPGSFDWSADYLNFSVREPFPSQTTGTSLAFGRVDQSQPLTITSLMSSPGVIFSDGMEEDFWEFGSGQKAVIRVADKKGRLVI
jgi:hypothetical protein